MGKDATMYQFQAWFDPDALSALYVNQAQAWFDSMWTTVSRERQ